MKPIEYADIVQKYPSYEKICEHFIELAQTEEDRKIINQILKNGTYKDFNVNTQLSNYNSEIKNETSRRLSITEILFFNRPLFNFIIENDINIFHGTNVNALPYILKHGLMSHKSIVDNNMDIKSGEAFLTANMFKKVYPDMAPIYRNFISLTDDFKVAKNYSINCTSSNTCYIMICLSENAIKEKYKDSIAYIKSDMTEIGVLSDISPEDIGCIITNSENIDYVRQIIGDKNIPVFGYSKNQTFELNRNMDNVGFYGPWNYQLHDELFDKYKEKIKYQLTEYNKELDSNQNTTNFENDLPKKELLSEDNSYKVFDEIKWEKIFYLIEKYRESGLVYLIEPDELVTEYKLDRNVAQRISNEINDLIHSFVREKEEKKKNETFVLDGFDENENEYGGMHR